MAMSSANHTQPKEMFQFGLFRVVSIEMSWSGGDGLSSLRIFPCDTFMGNGKVMVLLP